MSDAEWSELAENSPKKAFEFLVSRYGSLVWAIVSNKVGRSGTKEDIEDCVSDVFSEVFRTFRNYSAENGSLKTYISTVAKYTAIDCFKRLSARVTVSTDDEDIVLPPSEDNTEHETEKRIIKRKLWEAVKSLGEPDTSIIVYQYFYNFKTIEIAQKLSMSASAVQKRSQRARKKIKKILEKGDFYD